MWVFIWVLTIEGIKYELACAIPSHGEGVGTGFVSRIYTAATHPVYASLDRPLFAFRVKRDFSNSIPYSQPSFRRRRRES
jgi:hypothetical protein